MATCATGASVKSGVDGNLYVPIDASIWGPITSLPTPWWSAVFAWLLAPFEQKVSDICALNPDDPAAPGVDVWAAGLLIDPHAQQQIMAFLKQKFQYLQFQDKCVCNAPVGGGACTTETGTWLHANCVGGGCALGSNCCYAAAPIPGITGGSTETVHIPAGQHRVTLTVVGAPPYDGQIELYGSYTAEGACKLNIHPLIHDPSTLCDINTSEVQLQLAQFQSGGGTIGVDVPLRIEFANIPGVEAACGTSVPPGPAVVTQPSTLSLPGADTCGGYQDICNTLSRVSLKLDWLMRATPPANYLTRLTPGTAHAGLTGQGDIVVSGILALVVTLNVVPTPYGAEAGRPPTRWSAARISWSDPYGVIGQEWVGETVELVVPPTVTLIGYYLAPGVVATITEMVAGK